MGRLDDRLREELQFHLEQQIAKNIRAGMTPEEARRQALVKFGGVEPAREAAKDQARGAWALDLFRDMRIGLRTLARAPGFAVTTILTFALGIGAASAMFSVFEGVLLRPLPYPDSNRIVRVFQLGERGNRTPVSEPNFFDWRDQTRSYRAMAVMQAWGPVPINAGGEAQLASVSVVSQQFFDVMGVHPIRGRGFRPDELRPGGAPVALVSDSFWRRWRGDAVPQGDVIRSGPDSFTVIGVMPDRFDFPGQAEIWIPRELREPDTSRTAQNFQVIARLADHATLEQAQQETSALSRRLKTQHGPATAMHDAQVVPLLEVVTATSKATLQLLFAASVLLLVVACTNASNLMVVRGASRRGEFAVQLAMGATTGRLVRHLLAESFVICAIGAAIGIAGAASAVRLFVAIAPADGQRLANVSVSWPAVAFASVVSLLAACALSLAAAYNSRGVRLTEAISDSTRSGTGSRQHVRLREALIVTQVALTLVLLSGAALLGRSLYSVTSIDPGYSLEDGVLLGLTFPGNGTPDSTARQVAFQSSVIERLGRQPGVVGVGLINDFPLGSGNFFDGGFIELSRPDEFTRFDQINRQSPEIRSRIGQAEYRKVAGDYFGVMRIPLVEGRLIGESDTPESAHVAVISKSLAQTYWAGKNPIGRWVFFGNMDGDIRPLQIVGIVGDVREATPEAVAKPMLYASARQRPRQAGRATVIVRGPQPEFFSDVARRIVREVNPDVPVTLTSVSAVLDGTLGSRRFTLSLVGAFSVASLLLATLGVYGLFAYIVSQRTRELGIRLALGAEPRSLVWLVVKRGALLAAIGAVAGIAIARLASGTIEGLLYGVTAADPATIAATAAFMLAASMVATYAPARRIFKQSLGKTLRDI